MIPIHCGNDVTIRRAHHERPQADPSFEFGLSKGLVLSRQLLAQNSGCPGSFDFVEKGGFERGMCPVFRGTGRLPQVPIRTGGWV